MSTQLRRALSALTGALLSVFGMAATAADVPAVGAIAPEFNLPDQHGKPRQLTEWRGKWVVLYFYPKDDTPGCTEEACTFRDDMEQLTALDAQVVGISVDTSESHKAFAEKYKLPFPLLADAKADVATRYGALSNWLVIKLAKRYTFLIDPKGKVARIYLSVDTSRHSAEIVKDIKQLRQSRP
jgi:thioredoxin-dependent peroxiredoxin